MWHSRSSIHDLAKRAVRCVSLLALASFAPGPVGAVPALAQGVGGATVPQGVHPQNGRANVPRNRPNNVLKFTLDLPHGEASSFWASCSILPSQKQPAGEVKSCVPLARRVNVKEGKQASVRILFETGEAGYARLQLDLQPVESSPGPGGGAGGPSVAAHSSCAPGTCSDDFETSYSGSYELNILPDEDPPVTTIWVTPDGGTATAVADSTVHSVYFDLLNGDTQETWELECSGSAGIDCVGVYPGSITLDSAASGQARVDYRPFLVGGETVSLLAGQTAFPKGGGTFQVEDSGYYAVSVSDPATVSAPTTVDLSINNEVNQAREKCLTLPVGQGLVQCGDYVLVHAMPGFRTHRRIRAPTLIYNSGTAEVRPIVRADVTFPDSASLPEHFSAALFFDGAGTPSAESFYTTEGYTEGVEETRRFAVAMDANAVATGVYPHVFEARAWYAAGAEAKSDSGRMMVVNRRASPFGAGWWLAGLERLYVQTGGDALVVLGDASAKLFTQNPDDTYDSPPGDYSKLEISAGGGWDRSFRRGGHVHFDVAGRHTYTEDADGNRTTFVYDGSSDRVTEIIYEATQVTWDLHYGGDGVLDSIVDPGGRVASFETLADGRITRLYHPDGSSWTLSYSGGLYVPDGAADELGNADAIYYDDVVHPYRVRRPYLWDALTPGYPNIYVRSAVVAGITTDNGTPGSAVRAPSPNEAADTLIDPRGNKAVFKTNVFGEPTYVRDATGRETLIARNAASEPARVQYPNGRVVRLVWDDGRLEESWDSTYASDHGLAGEAKTSFYFDDPLCPYDLTRVERQVTASTALTTSYSYDPPGSAFRGCRLSAATDERGHVTEFDYLSDGRLSVITEKDVPVCRGAGCTDNGQSWQTEYRDIWTSLEYWPELDPSVGARGNLQRIETLHPGYMPEVPYPAEPADSLIETWFWYDGYGNISQRQDPKGYSVWQTHNSMNLAEQVIVQTDTLATSADDDDVFHDFEYDAAGNPTRVYAPYYRYSTPVGYREFTYNALNLPFREYDESGFDTEHFYDLAGNVIRTITRNGEVVDFHYDALNRPARQIIPASTQPFGFETGLGSAPQRVIPADTITWHYGISGAVDTVRTRSTVVTRSYYLDGRPEEETQSFGGRNYTLRYAYDLGGRRDTLQHPTALDSVFGDRRSHYAYTGPDLTSIRNPLGEVTTFEWDELGRQTRMVQDNGVETLRFYNDAGNTRFVGVNSPGGYLDYSDAGISGMDSSLVYHVVFGYDARGMIFKTEVDHAARHYTNVAYYDAANRLVLAGKQFSFCHYGNNIEPHKYCMAPFDTTLTTVGIDSVVAMDARGNPTDRWKGWAARIASCKGCLYFNPEAGEGVFQISYGLDSRLEFTDLVGGDIAGPENFQRYDRAGNLRFKFSADAGYVDSLYYFYVPDGKLARTIVETDPDREDVCYYELETEYEYDGLGRRVRKIVTPGDFISDSACDDVKDKDITHDYVYDGSDLLYERITEAWGPDSPTRPGETQVIEILYTRGPSGEAISRHIPTVIVGRILPNGEAVFLRSMFYHSNWQGTPVAATDTLGHRYELPYIQVREFKYQAPLNDVPWIYVFRIWSLEWRGAVQDNGVSFTGQPYDPETGLHYFRNRYYDAETGRFTQEDPIGFAGGLNLYGYAANNPVNFTDPFGLKVCFQGTAQEIGALKRGTEDATNTSIELDDQNCVSDFKSLDAEGFEGLQAAFRKLVDSDDYFIVSFLTSSDEARGRRSHFNPNVRAIYVARADFDFPQSAYNSCGQDQLYPWSMGAIVAHEMGHAVGMTDRSLLRVFRRGRPYRQGTAIWYENQYHKGRGQPLRCNR